MPSKKVFYIYKIEHQGSEYCASEYHTNMNVTLWFVKMCYLGHQFHHLSRKNGSRFHFFISNISIWSHGSLRLGSKISRLEQVTRQMSVYLSTLSLGSFLKNFLRLWWCCTYIDRVWLKKPPNKNLKVNNLSFYISSPP